MVVAMIVVTLAFLGLLVAVGVAMGQQQRRTRALEAQLHDPAVPTVRYLVPDGVDPAVVGGALAAHGFRNVLELDYGEEELLIACTADEREHARAVIEEIECEVCQPHMSMPPVRFMDEAA